MSKILSVLIAAFAIAAGAYAAEATKIMPDHPANQAAVKPAEATKAPPATPAKEDQGKHKGQAKK